MRSSSLALVVFRLAVLVALAVSAALLVDYLRPLPAFCDLAGGCEKVRASGIGRAGPLVPITGLVGFATLMAVSLSTRPFARRALVPMALVGGAVGATLLVVQAAVVGAFCKLCVVVDSSSLVAALAALAAARGSAADVSPVGLWAGASVLSIAAPVLLGVVHPSPPVPREIASLWQPGKINVVEFADFQCPFCRQLHPEMLQVLGQYGDRVHFVRLNMPLASHPQSRDAARAYVCADEQGKGSAMADALFTASGLSAAECRALAAKLGVAMPDYDKCVASPATEASLEAQVARVRAAGFRGLPTVWVGDEVVVGLQPIDRLEDAFARAASDPSGTPSRPMSTWLWAGLAIAVTGVGATAMRMSRRGTADGG
jgi:protein-disulfide isomerase